ncbi:hypothetical protein BN2364_0760 [Alloalcanivorax xenomutans]|uniref:hypothetical protein n=1 Tax=Alloalcanivorax xenomutans TaxID=1094342 RepID=UPI0006D5C741|nr:hypothetical protein [Alloalcanivorax xenomutans]PHS70469.1 MAG: hypothetical protein COB00_04265 [Alcanivorax sp.]CUR45201.1 hypothetical protein BN2364_0760 [Alloalcanivorax xenomutans]
MVDSVCINTDSVEISISGNIISVAFEDVVGIHAYVLEIPASSLTFVVLATESGYNLEVRSDMAGWSPFLRELGEHLPLKVRDLPGLIGQLTADTPVAELYP